MDAAATTVLYLRQEAPILKVLRFYNPTSLEVAVFIGFNDDRGWSAGDNPCLGCKAFKAQ